MESKANNYFDKIQLNITDKQKSQFETYYNFLIEYNNITNLTAITDKSEVYLKHFIDSISLLNYVDLEEGVTVADIGTGAGFPSVPLKIMRPDINLTLIDSLNKRIIFLKQLMKKLDIEAEIIHQRAEDIQDNQREGFDYVVSRAVANLRILSEFDLPYVKIGGLFIAYKGPDADDEIKEAENAISILGGQIENVISFNLENAAKRNFVLVRKINSTPMQYPRKPKKIINKPI